MNKEIRKLAFGENTDKWRIEHGFITPEWEMYARNTKLVAKVMFLYGIVIGAILFKFLQGVL